MWSLFFSLFVLATASNKSCAPEVGPPLASSSCHNLTARGSGAFILYNYDVKTLLGRRSVLVEEMANNVDDSIFCGYEMYPPEQQDFLTNKRVHTRWPYRYVPDWMPSASGVQGLSLGYPQGCGCTDAETSKAMQLFTNAGCKLTDPFTTQVECFLFGNGVLQTLSMSVTPQCAFRWTALFNYADSRIQAFKDVGNFSRSARLGKAALADAGLCPFAAGNTGLFLFSKYKLEKMEQFFISPTRGMIYAQVKLPGHNTPTQVFCSHLTVNSSFPLIPAGYSQATFKNFQVQKTIDFMKSKISQNPNHRVAYLGNPQFAIPRPVAPSYLVGNFPSALSLFTSFANANKLVDAYQVQNNTKNLPTMAANNPLTLNGAGFPTEGRNVSVIHNYIGSPCPPDRHQAFQAFATKMTVNTPFGPYTGFGSDSFGVRIQVCERRSTSGRRQMETEDPGFHVEMVPAAPTATATAATTALPAFVWALAAAAPVAALVVIGAFVVRVRSAAARAEQLVEMEAGAVIAVDVEVPII
jgi:hypothetical protein